MTKIKLYPNDTSISDEDKWIGTDGNNSDSTKNFTIAAVGAYINALGVTSVNTTDGTFINLTPNTATIGDVVVTADLSATGTPSSNTFLRGDNTWATPTGFVDGSGTESFIPVWQPSGTALTDSFLKAEENVGGGTVSVGNNINIAFTDVTNDYEVRFVLNGIGRLAIRETAVSANNNFNAGGYVKVGQTTATAVGSIAGALRYRSDANNSYLEVCMQTGASTYVWHVIQTYTW